MLEMVSCGLQLGLTLKKHLIRKTFFWIIFGKMIIVINSLRFNMPHWKKWYRL